MKPSRYILLKKMATLLCSILLLIETSAIAQGNASTAMNSNVLYYMLGAILIIIIAAMIFIIQKITKIAGEHGLTLFDFSIFKVMTQSSGIVAAILMLLVLWGIYLVVTYKVV